MLRAAQAGREDVCAAGSAALQAADAHPFVAACLACFELPRGAAAAPPAADSFAELEASAEAPPDSPVQACSSPSGRWP